MSNSELSKFIAGIARREAGWKPGGTAPTVVIVREVTEIRTKPTAAHEPRIVKMDADAPSTLITDPDGKKYVYVGRAHMLRVLTEGVNELPNPGKGVIRVPVGNGAAASTSA